MAYTFVLSDESINNRGFWIKTKGIDLKQFKRNPIMLWMHRRASGYSKDEPLPIGYWENIRVEGDKLLADAVFDESDEFAMKIKAKVDNKVIRMASAGIQPKVWSDSKGDIKPGQSYATLVKSLIKESSLVDLGSNNNALRLYSDTGELIELSDDNKNEYLPKLNIKSDMNLSEENLVILGLKDSDDDVAVNMAIQKLADQAAKVADMQAQLDEAIKLSDDSKAELDELKKSMLKREKDAFSAKLNSPELKLTAEQKNFYNELFDNSGSDTANKVVDLLPKYQNLRDIPGGDNGKSTQNLADEWDKAHKEGTLNKIREENPEHFKEMKKAKFNK